MFLNKKKLDNTKQDYQLGMIVKAIYEKDTKQSLPLEKYVITYLTQEEREQKEAEEQEMMFKRLASLPGAIVKNNNQGDDKNGK